MQYHRLRFAALLLLAAMIPDFDFVLGLLVADPNRFHSGITHSLGASVAVGLACGLVAGERRVRLGILCFAACASHAILDSLTKDVRPPFGVPLLWPLTQRRFTFPLIGGIDHGATGASVGEFLREVFSVHNLVTLLVEVGIGSALIIAALGIGRTRTRMRFGATRSLTDRDCSSRSGDEA